MTSLLLIKGKPIYEQYPKVFNDAKLASNFPGNTGECKYKLVSKMKNDMIMMASI